MEEILMKWSLVAILFSAWLGMIQRGASPCWADSVDPRTRLLLADQGTRKAWVVVAEKAPAPEQHAARELASFLQQVTGADFPVVHEYMKDQTCLLVGPDAARWADPDFSTEGLGGEGLVLRTVGQDLLLAGGRPRGTLYAVYTFLEDVIGCRWWTPTASTIPHHDTLAIGELNVRYVPPLEFREPYWGHTGDADWCVRNRLNGARTELDGARGGKYAELGGVHSFNQYLPPDRYFSEHPEWFSEIDGQRTASNSQICLTHPQALQELTKNVKDDIRAHYPGATSVWVSQNDWGGYCQCARCRELEERESSPAAGVVHFVNGVAAAVEQEFPDVAINTLAYDWSQKPPRNLQPRPNVVIWLCTTGCSYSQPYSHERNQVFQENIEAWARICNRIYIWDYVTNYAAYLCPHPNLRTLGPNVQFFVKNNVKGVFSLGAYSAPGAEMADLRAWVLAKLFWDPTRDASALIHEFLAGYYGPAAPHIQAYLDVFHDAIGATGEDLFMTQQPTSSRFLNLETLRAGWGHLQAAKVAVADDEDLRRRVEVAALPVQYVFLVRWDELWARAQTTDTAWPLVPDIRAVYDRLLAVMEENGITQFSEKNARDWFPSVRERIAVGAVAPPPGCEDRPRTEWADLQNVGFVARGETNDPPLCKKVVGDPLASTGTAAWLPGSHGERALTRELWRIPLVTMAAEAGQRLRCRLSIRCEVTGPEGIAFRCGIDGRGAELVVSAADLPDDQYHIYDLGVFDDLRGWIQLWIVPGNNPSIQGIWVDRAWLVLE